MSRAFCYGKSAMTQYALRSIMSETPYVIGPFDTKLEADAYVRERLIGPFEVVLMFPPKKETVGSFAPIETGTDQQSPDN